MLLGNFDEGDNQSNAVGYLVMLALPLAIDIVLLPITATRDLIVMGMSSRRRACGGRLAHRVAVSPRPTARRPVPVRG